MRTRRARRGPWLLAPGLVTALACSAPSSQVGEGDAAPGAPRDVRRSSITSDPRQMTPNVDAAPPAAADEPADTLNLDELLPLIAGLDADEAATLGDHPATATYERLPFYAGAGVVRVQAFLPQPVLFRYVYVPARRALLRTGTPALVRAANAGAGFQLSPAVGLAYVRFYLEAAGNAGWAGRQLAASADEVPWLPTTATDPEQRGARERLSARIPRARVEALPNGGLRVAAATVRGRTVELVTFEVAADGTVMPGQTTTLADDAPVVQVL